MELFFCFFLAGRERLSYLPFRLSFPTSAGLSVFALIVLLSLSHLRRRRRRVVFVSLALTHFLDSQFLDSESINPSCAYPFFRDPPVL